MMEDLILLSILVLLNIFAGIVIFFLRSSLSTEHDEKRIAFLTSHLQPHMRSTITTTVLFLRNKISFPFTADIYSLDGTRGQINELLASLRLQDIAALVILDEMMLKNAILYCETVQWSIPIVAAFTTFSSRPTLKTIPALKLPLVITTLSYNWDEKIRHIHSILPYVRNIVLLYPTSHKVLQASLHEQHVITQACARLGIKTYIIYVYDYTQLNIPQTIAHYADLIILPTTASESFVHSTTIAEYAAQLKLSVLIPSLTLFEKGKKTVGMGNDVEEQICRLVAQNLADVLVQNKKQVRFRQHDILLKQPEELAMNTVTLTPFELEQVINHAVSEKTEITITAR